MSTVTHTGKSVRVSPTPRPSIPCLRSSSVCSTRTPTTGHRTPSGHAPYNRTQDTIRTRPLQQDTGHHQDTPPTTGHQDTIRTRPLQQNTGHHQDTPPTTGHHQDTPPTTGHHQDTQDTASGHAPYNRTSGHAPYNRTHHQDTPPTTGHRTPSGHAPTTEHSIRTHAPYNKTQHQDTPPTTGPTIRPRNGFLFAPYNIIIDVISNTSGHDPIPDPNNRAYTRWVNNRSL